MSRARILSTGILFLIVIGVLGGLVARVQAATITVNTTYDSSLDPDPVADTDCSLREAIQNANDDALTYDDCLAGSSADVIAFTVGTITLDGNIFVNTDITIQGPVTLDGGGVTNVFVISGAVGAHLTTSGVTFQNGASTSGGALLMQGGTYTCEQSVFDGNTAENSGGAIYGNGVVDIQQCEFINNSAGDDGGAINHNGADQMQISTTLFDSNQAGTDPGRQTDGGSGGAIYTSFFTSITSTAFRNNSAETKTTTGKGGGAIFNAASLPSGLSILASAFSGNMTTGDQGDGGAIFNNTSGFLAVNYSHFGVIPPASGLPFPFDTLVTGNSASNQGSGGAIYSAGPTAMLGVSFLGNSAFNGGGFAGNSTGDDITIANSTFSDNTAVNRGGAVYQFLADDLITLTNVTIADNTADGGGGIYNNGDGGSGTAFDDMSVSNTILANNDPDNCAGGEVGDSDGNLVYPALDCPALAAVNLDPVLDPVSLEFSLASILTFVREIGSGSGALGNGIQAICTLPPILNLDQRLAIRPAGDVNCDIGAYESNLVGMTPTPTNTPTFTPTFTDTATFTPTATDTPTNTPTATPTTTATASPTDTPTATDTPTPTDTSTPTDTPTPSDTPTPTGTATSTSTATDTSTATFTPTATDTSTATFTPTATTTGTQTATATPTDTPTPTFTPTATDTSTATFTPTETGTATDTPTATAISTATFTPTTTETATATFTPTATTTSTATETTTATATSTTTETLTNTPPPSGGATQEGGTNLRVFLCDDLERQSSGAMTAFGGISNVRVGDIYGNVFCRIIVQDDQVITNLAEIGIQSVIDLGVVQAVDLFGLLPDGSSVVPFISPVRVCLRGVGDAIFLSAANAARTSMYLPVLADSPANYSCANVPVSGTVVLVRIKTGAAPSNPVGTTLSSCALTTTNPVNLRSEPRIDPANVLAVIPFATRLQALEHIAGWYRVNYGTMQGYVSESIVSTEGSCG